MTAITIHSVGQRSADSDTNNMQSQSLLQHNYFIAAAAIILALIILRIIVLRWRDQTMSDFFRINTSPRYPRGLPQNDSNYGSMPHNVQLTPLPTAYRPDHRTHAVDTDAFGRRLDPVGGDLDGKDVLPAYDSFDRPPKYIEADWSLRPSAVVPAPSGEQSGMAHLNTTDRPHRPFDDTHTAMEGPS